MIKYELSKHDFEALDLALKIAQVENTKGSHVFAIGQFNTMTDLRDKLRKAHTAWIETE